MKKTTDYSIDKFIGKLVKGLPSESYHTLAGSYSSTQLKTILESRESFFKRYIEKSIAREENPAFDVGTYFHTAILEPHKLNKECAVFEDGFRRGEKWEKFKKAHKGKAIITLNDKEKADRMIVGVKNSKITMGLLSKGDAEISAFHKFMVRTEGCSGEEITIKVRADFMSPTAIIDLKSTSYLPDNLLDVRSKIKSLDYDLSAALYLDVFEAVTGVERDFIWTFACKDTGKVANFKASRQTIEEGRSKYQRALYLIAQGISSNWAKVETIEEI